MTTRREEILTALHGRLKTVTGPVIERMADVPRETPAAGWINLRDDAPGEKPEPEAVLSPLSWFHTHVALVEMLVPGRTKEERHAAFDALLVRVAAAIEADRTLGGRCDRIDIEQPDTSNLITEGDAAQKGADLRITIEYQSTSRMG